MIEPPVSDTGAAPRAALTSAAGAPWMRCYFGLNVRLGPGVAPSDWEPKDWTAP
jgi:hypothetical protein